MCWRFSAGERAARPPLKIRSRARACRRGAQVLRCVPHSRPAHRRQPRRCRAPRFILGDPDLNQAATYAAALGESVERFSAQLLLNDLPLELDRMCAVLGHGLSPRKPGSVSRFSGPLPVHPKGCSPAYWLFRSSVGCASRPPIQSFPWWYRSANLPAAFSLLRIHNEVEQTFSAKKSRSFGKSYR